MNIPCNDTKQQQVQLNVRIPFKLRLKLAILARARGIGIKEIVVQEIEEVVRENKSEIEKVIS